MDTLAYILPLIWAAILATAVTLYVILDGFGLGLGTSVSRRAPRRTRDVMMNTIAPFWDGNQTWLVLGGGGLLAAFPRAYGVIMSGLYIPIIVMLLALIFRGVAFEFRWVAKPKHEFWDLAFSWGALVATFAQGVVLGGLLQGIAVQDGHFAGGTFDWLTPFALFCGLGLVAGYACSPRHGSSIRPTAICRIGRGTRQRSRCCYVERDRSLSACGRLTPFRASPSAGSHGRTSCCSHRSRC